MVIVAALSALLDLRARLCSSLLVLLVLLVLLCVARSCFCPVVSHASYLRRLCMQLVLRFVSFVSFVSFCSLLLVCVLFGFALSVATPQFVPVTCS